MIKYIYIIVCFIVFGLSAQAQELNAKLLINTRQLPSANNELFSSLESNLNQLLNDQKWTDATFSKNERIDCNITITLTEFVGETFNGNIQLTSRRPVYNSSYTTALLNFRDAEFSFKYQQGQTLDFNSLQMNDNLVAVISFYVYIIIGLDFDSFSSNGGRPYFAKAMDIANMAQALEQKKGWEPFSGKSSNRYDLAMALTEESSGSFHSMWYNYHRMGLDEMAANASRGRIRIIESMNDIQKLHEARPSSPLITLISETKIDEVVRVCSNATAEEKKDLKALLTKIFPTKSHLLNSLK